MAAPKRHPALGRVRPHCPLHQATTNLRRTREIEAPYIELDRLISVHMLPDRAIDALFDAALGTRVRRSVYTAILRNQASPRRRWGSSIE